MASSGDSGAPGPPKTRGRNRLSEEKSPYLLQHAGNPVDWYPWGQEAFDKAKEEDKLIFLSVGYSTCHWCHVMERESFENEEIGQLLNEKFVSIKVDREERPDVDRIYMTFVQATTKQGGWPMSVWLTPDLKPLIGGTYFPPNDRYYGRPGFKSILGNIAAKWESEREAVERQGAAILDALTHHTKHKRDDDETIPEWSVISKCYDMLETTYEPNMGGFGKAPKFPQPVNFSFLFRVHHWQPDSAMGKKALSMCLHTIRMMAKGGMHDHVAQGFHRYSTDDNWHVPHFEKMLYDQAQLVVVYLETYQISKHEEFAEVAEDILQYVSRDLSDASGGFYSAEDADSYPEHTSLAKREGAFCVWTKEEIDSILDEPVEGKDGLFISDVFSSHFDIRPTGNVEPYQDPHKELTSQNVLIIRKDAEETAAKFNLDMDTLKKVLQRGKERLLEVRQQRPRPHLDTKMITAWNGLMISGYAKAAQLLSDPQYTQRALQAVEFLQSHLYEPKTGTLLRSCYVGEDKKVSQRSAPIDGFVDDYAFLIKGLVDLYETCFDEKLLAWAEKLQEKMDVLFWDEEDGGYFISGSEDGSLCLRLKDDQDGAEPSTNSVAAMTLQRLASLLERGEWRDRAERTMTAFSARLQAVPVALPEMVAALLCHLQTPKQVIVVGGREADDTQALLRCLRAHFLPNHVVMLHDPAERSLNGFLTSKVKVIASLEMVDGKATAYVCQNYACALPVTTPEALEALLLGGEGTGD